MNHPDTFYENLGRWLRNQRESMCISQESMGKELDVSFQMIQKYERGDCRIPVDKLVVWCRACAVNIQHAVAAAQVPAA